VRLQLGKGQAGPGWKRRRRRERWSLCLDESKKFPEVAATFQKAFDQLDEAEGISVPPRGDQKTGVGSR